MQNVIVGVLIVGCLWLRELPCQQTTGSNASPGVAAAAVGGGGSVAQGFTNWRPEYEERQPPSNGTGDAGVTYYWGSHQVGESVLAFSRDRFTSPHPVNAYRTLSYQQPESRISYLEVFVKNAAPADQVYVSQGGIGTSFISVFIGSQSPTTCFEYKATLYGFE